jgi:dTDP-4-amino-4,6-dideoxygalactose transaminase
MIKLVDPWKQHESIEDELLNIFQNCVRNSSFIGGKPLQNFEKLFAEFCKCHYAIGVSNGTSALEIALKSLNVGQGDEIITVSNTFFATVEAIYNVGATPVFVDVCLDDGLMDINQIENLINKKTKALLPVHLFGHLVNMKKISEIADRNHLKVIEDASQAHGASAYWGNIGEFSDAATFSFYPGKNLGAFGDAGAIISNKIEIAQLVSKLRDHGRISKYEHELVGTNARLDSLQAEILSLKLSKLLSWNNQREKIANSYLKIFSKHNFKVLYKPNEYKSAWHLFVVRVKNRDAVISHLKNAGIESGIHYPLPLHNQPALIDTFAEVNLPITELLCQEIVTLPIHPFLNDTEVELIIREFLKIAEPA